MRVHGDNFTVLEAQPDDAALEAEVFNLIDYDDFFDSWEIWEKPTPRGVPLFQADPLYGDEIPF